MKKEIVSEEKNKPVRDEQTLAQVLEAAYVLQEHNRELRNKKADPKLKRDQLVAEHRTDSSTGVPQSQDASPNLNANSANASTTLSLAQIVEIQQQIQVRHLELENVMSLVADRLSQLAGAGGVAIGILDGNNVHYRAAAGVMALPTGTEVPLEKALCVHCLRSGQVLRCTDVNSELRLNLNECRRRGIQSVLAVPVFHDGVVAGSLELYFTKTRALTDEDVHTCQLMAGLVSASLARNERVNWKKSLATERTVMLEALEKLKPNLAALADGRAPKNLGTVAGKPTTAVPASTFVCHACGHELVGQEQFCGNCGSPRSGDYEAIDMPSKMPSPEHVRGTIEETPPGTPAVGVVDHEDLQTNLDEVEADERKTDSIGELPEPNASVASYVVAEPLHHEATESSEMAEVAGSEDFENAAHADLEIPKHAIAENYLEAPERTALATTERSTAWSSAATTLDFFHHLASAKDRGAWSELWNTRRGDLYLVIAVVLFLGAVRWGIWSNHSVRATGNPTVSASHRRAAPDANLSLFDRILVKLGLAEAPDPPAYKGNPAAQVWVDLQTALYYCPGTDLYGKTSTGRFSSQRAAQLDQFEPAYRKACD